MRHAVPLALLCLVAATGCGGGGSQTPSTSCATPNLFCTGVCIDPLTNHLHCGGCGKPCDTGLSCVDGSCAVACPTGQVVCGSTCATLASDPANCGKCGTTCKPGELCMAGACALSCSTGLTACGGGCVDTQIDARHCGACATACKTGEACVAGKCGAVCADGQKACGGVCANLATDDANCGDCGVACGMGTSCVMGKCVLSCGNGGMICGGNCVDPMTDDANCGGCTMPCDMGTRCVAGKCAPTCSARQMLCGAACVDLRIDPLHCGKCNNACDKNTQLCSGGVCVPNCVAPLVACNMMLACVDPRFDPDNCSGCGMACPAAANGARVCNGGACGFSCNKGFLDCDGAANNGCETNVLGNDRVNCGACGKVCGVGTSCVAGVCTKAAACGGGKDPESGAPYSICSADANGIFLSSTGGGGNYHALQICQLYGYTKLAKFGGNCSSVCGYCNNAFSCMAPQNPANFDGSGSCSSDQFGPILCSTVIWTCTP